MAAETQRYPLFSLAKTLATAEAVRDGGGMNSPVQKSVIAHALACSETSGAFLQRLATARCYGLIEGRGAFKLTEAARRYFFPSAPGESERALLAFVAAPPVFEELIKRLDGNKIPTREMLANILHREFAVGDSWKDRVAGFFIQAATQSGLLDAAGFLRYSSAYHAMQNSTTIAAKTPQPDSALSHQANSSNRGVTEDYSTEVSRDEGFDVWDYSFKGKTVILKTPKDIPLALWQKLSNYLQVIKPEDNT